ADVVLPVIAAKFKNMQMVRPCRFAVKKLTRYFYIRHEFVVQLTQSGLGIFRLLKIGNGDSDINDRLGCQAWDCRTPHMLYVQQNGAKGLNQAIPLLLKEQIPMRIV